MQPNVGYVYFLYCEGFIKIGTTIIRPRERLASMQIGCPFPIHIAAYWEMESGYAMPAERFLHREFAARRVSGEWFSISPNDISKARPAAKAYLLELRLQKVQAEHPRRRTVKVDAPYIVNYDFDEALDLILKSGECERFQKSAAITRRFALADLRRSLNQSDDLALTLLEIGREQDGLPAN